MKEPSSRYVAAFGFVLWALPLFASEQAILRVHLFKGEGEKEHAILTGVTILKAATHPALTDLKSKAAAPAAERTASALDAILASFEMKSVDDLYEFTLAGQGDGQDISKELLQKPAAFRFTFAFHSRSARSIDLSITVERSKLILQGEGKDALRKALLDLKEGRSDRILDTRLDVEIGDPMIVAIPDGNVTWFMMLLANSESEDRLSERPADKKSGLNPASPIVPKPVHILYPAYPEELRKRGVQGQVELRVAIDEDGKVIDVRVAKSLHPYLDFAAVQALRQWTYEPVLNNGKPAAVAIDVIVNFDPESYRLFEAKPKEGAASAGKNNSPPSDPRLEPILNGIAEYCRRLKKAALDFICQETIDEIHYNFAVDPKWEQPAVAAHGGGTAMGGTWIPMWDPLRTIKSKYSCDYLMVQKAETVVERRIVLRNNGRTMPDRRTLLEEKRFTALNPILAAVQLFDRDRQSLFNYRIIDDDKVHGRRADVIEAIPKSGNTWGVEYAKVWIDRENFQVLRSEIQGVPLEGYNDVLQDATNFNVMPILTTTHTYEYEKNGIRFPGRSVIQVRYPPPKGAFGGANTMKLKIDMKYEKYQFFAVESDTRIKN